MNQKLKAKVDKYLKKAEGMFENMEIKVPEKVDLEKASKEVAEMSMAYYNDAKHFYSLGEYENALASLEYAEGWLDAGKRIGIIKETRKEQ